MFYNKGQKAQLQQAQLRALQVAMLNPLAMQGGAVPMLPQAVEMMPTPTTPMQQNVRQMIRQSPKSQKRQYISIQVLNTTSEEQTVVLFDAIGTYQFQNGVVINPGVKIKGLSKDYQVLQTRFLAGNSLYFDQMNLYVSEQAQFDQPIQIYQDDIATNNSRLTNSIYASQGLNSTQFNANRVEIYEEFAVKGDTALVYTQQPNSEVIFRLFIGQQVTFD